MCDLSDRIQEYYDARDLKWPDIWQALGWAATELGEVYEVLLAESGEWTRNNPGSHSDFDASKLEEELGDVIMMVMVAGMVRGLDPIDALLKKMDERIKEGKKMTCGRCEKQIAEREVEYCWWCGGDLCPDCWDKVGHCGHKEADEANESARQFHQLYVATVPGPLPPGETMRG